MKRLFLLSVLAVMLPASVLAQDDMYFVPTKKNVEKAKKDYGMPRDTYYSGSNRSVDDYNRRYVSMVQPVDSLGNIVGDSISSDIIELDGVAGIYPDSLSDYEYTRRMSRWDDYEWRDGYRAGYADGRWGRWGWSSYYPYYSGWYGGWYDPWYDPWYYGGWGYWGYAGWYDPWYGWGWPGYWHGHWHGGWYPSYGIALGRRSTGTRNHSGGGNGYNYRRYNSIGGNRGLANNRGVYNNVNNNGANRNANFGGVRSSNGNTYQNNTSSPSRNSSFGGTRSGAGGSHGSGGNRGGGGGHFGGGRR